MATCRPQLKASKQVNKKALEINVLERWIPESWWHTSSFLIENIHDFSNNLKIWCVYESDSFSLFTGGLALLSYQKKVKNISSLAILAMVSRHLSLLCRAEDFSVWDLQGRGLACSIFSLGLEELPNGKVSHVCFRAGLCAARQGKHPQLYKVAPLQR